LPAADGPDLPRGRCPGFGHDDQTGQRTPALPIDATTTHLDAYWRPVLGKEASTAAARHARPGSRAERTGGRLRRCCRPSRRRQRDRETRPPPRTPPVAARAQRRPELRCATAATGSGDVETAAGVQLEAAVRHRMHPLAGAQEAAEAEEVDTGELGRAG